MMDRGHEDADSSCSLTGLIPSSQRAFGSESVSLLAQSEALDELFLIERQKLELDHRKKKLEVSLKLNSLHGAVSPTRSPLPIEGKTGFQKRYPQYADDPMWSSVPEMLTSGTGFAGAPPGFDQLPAASISGFNIQPPPSSSSPEAQLNQQVSSATAVGAVTVTVPAAQGLQAPLVSALESPPRTVLQPTYAPKSNDFSNALPNCVSPHAVPSVQSPPLCPDAMEFRPIEPAVQVSQQFCGFCGFRFPFPSRFCSQCGNRQLLEQAQPVSAGESTSDEGLSKLIDRLEMPRSAVPTFYGDPLSFREFCVAFQADVGERNVGPEMKLRKLSESCKGKAHEAIRPFLLMPAKEGYERAWQTLRDRFGNSVQIARACINALVDAPAIKPHESGKLLEFSDKIKSCMITLQAIGKSRGIDSQESMAKVMKKLPQFVQSNPVG
jgi:hypothetical protein